MLKAPRFWYQSRSLLSYSLLPFSFLYQFVVALRRFFYKFGIKKVVTIPVPVVVVGNITVGGTGKTPLVIWLVQYLMKKGFQPGVVSRGYGGEKCLHPQQVSAESDAATVGDEALLIARQAHCPVVVGVDRPAAAKKLVRELGCDIVLSDDGLQHYALDRDIEIVVIDEVRQYGNGYCLPAGPLREPVSRLSTVDFVISNGNTSAVDYTLQLQATGIYSLTNSANTQSVNILQGKTIHAVAGIGNPERFFQQLTQFGAHVIPHAFPDHHQYVVSDLQYGEDAFIVMTEKDAVKCERFKNEQIWVLPVHAVVSDQFEHDFSQRLSLLV